MATDHLKRDIVLLARDLGPSAPVNAKVAALARRAAWERTVLGVFTECDWWTVASHILLPVASEGGLY